MTLVGGTVWLEILHYLGIAFWLGSVAMLDFRLLGLSTRVPVRAFHLSAGAYVGLALTLTTGTIMFLPNASGYVYNQMFVGKMILLVLAIAIGLGLHSKYVRQSDQWPDGKPPIGAKIAGAVSLLLWFGVLVAGRQITYYGFTQG